MNSNLSFFFLGILSLCAMLFLSYQMRPLNVRPGVPNGMITYQLSGTPENVAAYNAVWQEKGVMDTARNHIWFDFIYLVIYSLFFYTATRRFIRLNPAPTVLKYSSVLIFASLLPGMLDAVENLFLMKWLNGQIDSFSPGMIFIVASLKYGIAAILLFGAIYDWIRNTNQLLSKKP